MVWPQREQRGRLNTDHNPYAPPRANVEGAGAIPSQLVPAERLYSLGQITVATFLGSPLAGAWLMATNHKSLGQAEQAGKSMWLAVGGTLLLLVASTFLPERFPNSVLPVACALGFRAYAEATFGKDIKSHQAMGGPRFSWWRAVGIALLCVVALLAVIMGVLVALEQFGVIFG